MDPTRDVYMYAPLEGGSSVLEAEGHGSVVEATEWGDERSGQLIGGVHRDLVVPRVRVQKAEGLIAGGGIDHLVNSRRGNGSVGQALLRLV